MRNRFSGACAASITARQAAAKIIDDDFRAFAAEVREKTGGIPVGFKLSAQHIEKDIDAALDIGVDYIILDGRGGGTGPRR